MKPSFHNFPAKPKDKAYVTHGERSKQVNSARTNWRKKLIAGMLEGYSSTMGRSPRFAGRDRLAQANAGDSMSKAPTSPTSRIPDTRPSQQGRVRKGVREEIINRIINEITISNANVGSSNKADYADPGGGGGGGGLSGGFGSSGGGSRSFASTNSGEMSRGTGNQRLGSRTAPPSTLSKARAPSPPPTSRASTPPTSRASTPPATGSRGSTSLRGGFGSSGGGSRNFASTNSGEMARGTGNQRFGSRHYGMNTNRANANIRKTANPMTARSKWHQR